jgi:hypothetical protein
MDGTGAVYKPVRVAYVIEARCTNPPLHARTICDRGAIDKPVVNERSSHVTGIIASSPQSDCNRRAFEGEAQTN